MRTALGLAVGFGMAGLFVSPARACSFPPSFTPFEPSMVSETEAPEPAKVVWTLGDIVRGTGPERTGCNELSATLCDDVGIIHLHLANFDPSLGYRFEVTGELPEGLSLPAEPVQVADAHGDLTLHWIDGSSDAQEAFDFQLVVVAIDPSGREGPPSERLRIRHRGSSGCGAAPSAPVAPGGLPA